MVKPKNVTISASSTNKQCSNTKIPFEEPDGMTDIDLREIISCQSTSDTKCITKYRKHYVPKLLFTIGTGFIIITCFFLTLLLINDSLTWPMLSNSGSKNTKFQKSSTLNELSIKNKLNINTVEETKPNVIFEFPSKNKIKRDIGPFYRKKIPNVNDENRKKFKILDSAKNANAIENDFIKWSPSDISDKNKILVDGLSATTYSYTANEINTAMDNSLNQNRLNFQRLENGFPAKESVSSSLITDGTTSMLNCSKSENQSGDRGSLDNNSKEDENDEGALVSTTILNKNGVGPTESQNENLENFGNDVTVSSTTAFYDTNSLLASRENKSQSDAISAWGDNSEEDGDHERLFTAKSIYSQEFTQNFTSKFDSWENKNEVGQTEPNAGNLENFENDVHLSSTTTSHDATALFADNQSDTRRTLDNNSEKDGDHERIPTSTPIYFQKSTQDCTFALDSSKNGNGLGLTEPSNSNLEKNESNSPTSSTTVSYDPTLLFAVTENGNHSDTTEARDDNLEDAENYKQTSSMTALSTSHSSKSDENVNIKGLEDDNSNENANDTSTQFPTPISHFHENKQQTLSILNNIESENQLIAKGPGGIFKEYEDQKSVLSSTTAIVPSHSSESKEGLNTENPETDHLKENGRSTVTLSSTTDSYAREPKQQITDSQSEKYLEGTRGSNSIEYENMPNSTRTSASYETTNKITSTISNGDSDKQLGVKGSIYTQKNDGSKTFTLLLETASISSGPAYEVPPTFNSIELENQLAYSTKEDFKLKATLISKPVETTSETSSIYSNKKENRLGINSSYFHDTINKNSFATDADDKENLIDSTWSKENTSSGSKGNQLTSAMPNSDFYETMSQTASTTDNQNKDDTFTLLSVTASYRSGLTYEVSSTFSSIESQNQLVYSTGEDFKPEATTISKPFESAGKIGSYSNKRENQLGVSSSYFHEITNEKNFATDIDSNENLVDSTWSRGDTLSDSKDNQLTSAMPNSDFYETISQTASTTEDQTKDETFTPLSVTASYSGGPTYEVSSTFNSIESQNQLVYSTGEDFKPKATSIFKPFEVKSEIGSYSNKRENQLGVSSSYLHEITNKNNFATDIDSNENPVDSTWSREATLSENKDNQLTSATPNSDFYETISQAASITEDQNKDETFTLLSVTPSYSSEPTYEVPSTFNSIESQNQLVYSTGEDFKPEPTPISKPFKSTGEIGSYSNKRENQLGVGSSYVHAITNENNFATDTDSIENLVDSTWSRGDTSSESKDNQLTSAIPNSDFYETISQTASTTENQNKDETCTPLSVTASYSSESTYEVSSTFSSIESQNQLVYSTGEDFKPEATSVSKPFEGTGKIGLYSNKKENQLGVSSSYFHEISNENSFATDTDSNENLIDSTWSRKDTSSESKGSQLTSAMPNSNFYKTISQTASTIQDQNKNLPSETNLDREYQLSASAGNSDTTVTNNEIEIELDSESSSNITLAEDKSYVTSTTTNSNSYKSNSVTDDRNKSQLEKSNDGSFFEDDGYNLTLSSENVYNSYEKTTKIASNTDRNDSEGQESLTIFHKNNLNEENYLKYETSTIPMNKVSSDIYETVEVLSSTTEGFDSYDHTKNTNINENENKEPTFSSGFLKLTSKINSVTYSSENIDGNLYKTNNYDKNENNELESTTADSSFSDSTSINYYFDESEHKESVNINSDGAHYGTTNVTYNHENNIAIPAASDLDEFTTKTESVTYTDKTLKSFISGEDSVAKPRTLNVSRFHRKASALRNRTELLQKNSRGLATNFSREAEFNFITSTFPAITAVPNTKNNLGSNSFPLHVRWSNQDINNFQNMKNVAKEFGTVNEHLQTSQQSTANQNFDKTVCPTFISPMNFPVLQQPSAFPYLYNANQGSPYANLMSLPIPRTQANSYIAQQYPYIGANSAPSYSKAMMQQSGYLMYNVNGQNIIAPSPGGQYYVCNPLPNVLGNSNTDGIPQIEIRKSLDDSNLQQQSIASDNFENRTRASRNCPFGERSCEDDSKCIKTHHFCDGEVQCKDASDEAFCPCKFRIEKSRQCDGYFDCPNGEDEFNCFGCEADMFSCDDWSPNDRIATCIPIEQRCDGIPQCPTEKDEHDCSIITGTLSEKQHFIVSATVGFLYRNFKGRWYPACRNPELWANDACQSAAGPSTMAPLTHLVPVDINYNGPYISASRKEDTKIVNSCEPGAAIFVECPPLVCGMRKKIRNPYRTHEVDTSAEQILSQFQRINEPSESRNFTDSVLGDGRVVGGKPSQPEAWPWIVSVYRNGVFHCGGALINELWIVTAGHCVEKYWHYYYEVQAGVLRRYSYAPMVQHRMISHVIAHQLYDRTKLKNDLALMKMSKPLQFGRYVRPICLPSEITAGKNFKWGPGPGTVCTAVGWGATVEHGSDPDHLREVEVPILKHCKHREDQEGHEICAGLMEGGKDACQGDSGGPFMCRNPNAPNQWYLAGIVSHGEGCARPNEPGVYTRVSLFLEWIFENIRAEMIPQTRPLHHCPGYICRKTNRCIANKRRCNKIVDCLLGDDEMLCEKNSFNEIFKHAMRHMLLGTQQDHLDDDNATNLLSSNINVTTVLPPTETNSYNIDNLENKSDIAATSTLVQETTTIPGKLSNNQSNNKNYVCKKILQTIDISKQCDRTADCEDATDEEECTCASYLKYSHPQAICDGITDCFDMSDEANCHVCKQNEYHCRHSNICILTEKRCNNVPDCPMEEDEWDCFALTNDKTITLDGDLRPYLNDSGLVSFNHNGTWRPVCSNWTGTEAAIAADACFYLGFSDYKSFLKVPVYNNPLQIIQKFSAPVASVVSVGNRCTALFVKCSDVIDVTHLTEHANISKIINRMQGTPWNAEVYVNGIFKCTGTILDVDWIITSTSCFENDFKLENKYVAVLLGRSKTYLNFMGPHEQIVRIVESIQVHDSDIIILRLSNRINISRYIRPIRLSVRDYTVSERETCIALGRNFDNFTESVILQAVPNCTFGFRCFKRTQPLHKFCQNKHFTSWSGSIVCQSKHGWYPSAVFHDAKGSCGFATTGAYTSVQYWRANILKLMKQTAFAVDAPLYKGFRCSLGRCLEEHKICDGLPDCRDAEDEDSNYCSEKRKHCHTSSSCVCLKSELKCQNGKCVPKTAFCDTFNDCGDWSDEPESCNCRAYLNLTNPAKICDGIRNCQDRTDEDPYVCKCKGYHFLCGETHHCIPQDMVCDGVPDCPDGQDETNCIALTSSTGSPISEVQVRTAGIWHPGCFHKYLTTLQLERICEKIGYTGGSALRINPANNRKTGWRPITDPFVGILIHHGAKRNIIIAMRSGDNPFVSLKPDFNCYRLFLQCS